MKKRASNLVVVESPAKAKTIAAYLGADFAVTASFGHVRDLPKSKLGVNVEKDFAPQYIVPKKSSKKVGELKKEAKGRARIWLATDPDREGEAIAWHVSEVLADAVAKDTPFSRIVFHEITKPAVVGAIAHPRELDQRLVDAQQARRVLDRLVGYTLSPLLWKKLFKGLSAGRVQSVALKYIVDRERQRQAFSPQEFWTLTAALQKGQAAFAAEYVAELKNEAAALKVKQAALKADFVVSKVTESVQQRRPQAPFTTSTLQQSAANTLGFTAKRTMTAAQRLYESGFITYMRTDSVTLASSAVREIRAVIQKQFGDEYVPDKAPLYRAKKSAQEAHEAVRPTHVRTSPETVAHKAGADEAKLYDLIWRRTLASQMTPAKVKKTAVDITAAKHHFRANGLVIIFAGFRKALGKAATETVLPPLEKGDKLILKKLIEERHETEPPARYTEASLIKALEEAGVGRPSTYAPTISTLYARNYISREQRALLPQEVGFQVIDLLAEHFPMVVDAKFTADMEENLDRIAAGDKQWVPVIRDFYNPFAKVVKKKEKEIVKVVTDEQTDEKCPECGEALVIKTGRFGRFFACSGFPKCRFTRTVVEESGVPCAVCGQPLVEKATKRGKRFLGCSQYPQCTFALWDKRPSTLERKLQALLKEGINAPHADATRAALKKGDKGNHSGGHSK